MNKDEVLNDFLVEIEELFGMYFDSVQGFAANAATFEKAQKEMHTKLGFSIEHLDSIVFMYGEGDPNFPSAKVLQTSTQGQYKRRNAKNGKNTIALGNLCISQIYSYWEDYYRDLLAKAVGKDKKQIGSDLFGDIRHLRISIIHHQGIAKNEVGKNKIIKWFNYNEPIQPTEDHIKGLIFLLKNEVERMRTAH